MISFRNLTSSRKVESLRRLVDADAPGVSKFRCESHTADRGSGLWVHDLHGASAKLNALLSVGILLMHGMARIMLHYALHK